MLPMLTVSLPDAPSYLFVGDQANLRVLDHWTPSPVTRNVVYVTRPVTNNNPLRNDRKRGKRAILFGEAESISGTVTFHADRRTESYPIEDIYDVESGILCWQECSLAMSGYLLYVTWEIDEATGLSVRDFRLEFEVLG